jgi:acyl-CoA synthetase (AMP-forming)/AMP-acid ligase II
MGHAYAFTHGGFEQRAQFEPGAKRPGVNKNRTAPLQNNNWRSEEDHSCSRHQRIISGNKPSAVQALDRAIRCSSFVVISGDQRVNQSHFPFWPRGLLKQLHVPETSLYFNLEVAAARYPSKPAIVFYDTVITYGQLKREVDTMAGFLQQECRVKQGDRVLLFSQNCPQFIIAYYAVLRADAVVVPINAMSTTQELSHYIADSGATLAFCAQELHGRITPHMREGTLRQVVLMTYSDYLNCDTSLAVPDWVRAPGSGHSDAVTVLWADAIALALAPAAQRAGKDDVCVLPYTSGTTGHPKGCMHTHATMMSSLVASQIWRGITSESVFLAVAPLFHLLGMQNGMNLPILTGGTIVMLARWDRDAAATLVDRYRVSVWAAPPAMLVDFFANPCIEQFDLSSLAVLSGGGAPMPDAVAAMLKDKFEIVYNEGYGMTETASFLHGNPLLRSKRQCLGMPTFGVDSRVVDPATFAEVAQGEVGELVTSGPQVMRGYWNNARADQDAFIELDGKRFLRTGDLCSVDAEGYFFMHDRLKRMINVSGYKVWPAELETIMYAHPAVHEACVIGVKDERSGELVKLILSLKPVSKDRVSAEDIIDWCRARMAAYKVPRLVEFVDQLPKSGTGKILWREIQERENRAR